MTPRAAALAASFLLAAVGAAGAAEPRDDARALALPADAACRGAMRCLVARAYAADPPAQRLALALFDEEDDVAGVEGEKPMDGGFRGMLALHPCLPVGKSRRQLAWVLAAARELDAFFGRELPAAAASGYRWRGLTFRFFRSTSAPPLAPTPRRTPSAYAVGPRPAPKDAKDDIPFSLGWNVDGSLLTDEARVRETLFHELFHINDERHGDWSPKALSADYDAIVARCGAGNVACLRPYAPSATKVRGGTYYSFQPNNGETVREYAAELAVRWYDEQRAVLAGRPLPGGAAFKCGPPENARAWSALVQEFFGGADLVPPCRR